MIIFIALFVIIAIFVLPAYFTIRSKKSLTVKGLLLGLIFGLGIMTYDFDGFTNPGGPNTPITNALPLGMFSLPILGIIIGLTIGYITNGIYKNRI